MNRLVPQVLVDRDPAVFLGGEAEDGADCSGRDGPRQPADEAGLAAGEREERDAGLVAEENLKGTEKRSYLERGKFN